MIVTASIGTMYYVAGFGIIGGIASLILKTMGMVNVSLILDMAILIIAMMIIAPMVFDFLGVLESFGRTFGL